MNLIIKKKKIMSITKKNPKSFLLHFSKEGVWSLFLCFNILLPFLNTFELSVSGTQNKSFTLVATLNLILFFSFKIMPTFYDWTINLIFSDSILFYLKKVEQSVPILTKYPRSVGVFYGVCLLSFLLRFENPDSTSFYVINVLLLSCRNLFLLPYLGFCSLTYWIMGDLEYRVANHQLSDDIYSFINVKNHHINIERFTSVYFHKLPLVNKNSAAYNLTTKRNLLKVVQTFLMTPLSPEKIKIIAKYTFGSTALGTTAVQMGTTGYQTDKIIDSTNAKTNEFCNTVITNSKSTPQDVILAKDLVKQSESAFDSYYSGAGDNTFFRGANRILSRSKITQKLKTSQEVFEDANTLRTINGMPDCDHRRKLAAQLWDRPELKGMIPDSPGSLPSTPPVPSVIEYFSPFFSLFTKWF